jgi:hypothetical protein
MWCSPHCAGGVTFKKLSELEMKEDYVIKMEKGGGEDGGEDDL